MTDDGRIALLERRTEEPIERAQQGSGLALPHPPRVAMQDLTPAVQRPRLEDLLAGRVLAWAGGLAVLVGIVLLFAVAVSRGWIGEGARTLIGALASFTLVVAGAWLHDRRGRTDAALAAAAAGIAGLFATAVVASRVYELVPLTAGLGLSLATGIAATWLALRWRSQGVAALGILGGLAAPLALGQTQDGGTLALVLIAAAAAAAICVRERWEWLSAASFLVLLPQVTQWLATEPGDVAVVACLIGFGAVTAASAVGFELRSRADAVRTASVLLLAVNALVLAVAGWLALDGSSAWLVGLAAVHGGVGVALLGSDRASRAVGLLGCALGLVLLDIALGQVLDGIALTAAWAGVAAVAARLLARARPGGLDDASVGAALGGHLALALGHVLVVDAPPAEMDAITTTGSLAVALVAATCFASGALLTPRPEWRIPLHAVGLAAVAYLMALELEGIALVAVWATEAVALAELARHRDDDVAAAGAGAFLALAAGHAVGIEAPPRALVDGSGDLLTAGAALAAVAFAAWRCALLRGPAELRVAAWNVSALALLHLASISVVTAAGAGPRAQALLSALWGAVGVGALVAGLLRDTPALRAGALALLAAALAKVFLYDFATLTPMARVASFIVLGLLLLLGAFAWQRIRPRPLPDLREAPPAARG